MDKKNYSWFILTFSFILLFPSFCLADEIACLKTVRYTKARSSAGFLTSGLSLFFGCRWRVFVSQPFLEDIAKVD